MWLLKLGNGLIADKKMKIFSLFRIINIFSVDRLINLFALYF